MDKNYNWDLINKDIQSNLTNTKGQYYIAGFKYAMDLFKDGGNIIKDSQNTYQQLHWKSIEGLVMQQYEQDVKDKKFENGMILLRSVMITDSAMIKS